MPARKWLPILGWLPNYHRADLPGDLGAGLTTAVLLIPQAMAYAMLAGLPPIHGLYAATVPLLAYAVFGSSPQLAVGPVAIDSLLVAVGVGALTRVGTDAYVAYAILLAAMVGIIQLALGVMRLGFVVNFLSRPVISAFTSAAALVIGFSQLRHLLGVDLASSNHVHEIAIEAAQRIGETSLPTLGLGLGSVAALLLLAKLAPRFPRALALVVVGTLSVWAFDLDARGVAIVGEVPRGLPRFSLPHIDLVALRELAPTALAIAMVSFMEAISVAKSLVSKAEPDVHGRKPRIDANRELIGLGAANLAGSTFGGYPIAGGLSRSAVNAQAGARTGLAGIVTATVVMLTLVALTPLLHDLPNAVLAAIIITAVAGLVDVATIRKLWKIERSELVLLLATFIATLALGIIWGLAVGVAASIVWFIARQTRPHTAILGRLPGTTIFRNVARFPEAEQVAGILALRVDSQFYFGNVEFLEQLVEKLLDDALARSEPIHAVILDASAMNRLDSSAEAALRELDASLRARGVTLHFAAVKGPVRDMMARSGLAEQLGPARLWDTVDEAVSHTREGSGGIRVDVGPGDTRLKRRAAE